MAEVCCEVCWTCYQFYTAAEFALTLWSNGCNDPYAHQWWNGGIDHNSVMVTYHEKSGMSLSPTKYQCTQSYVVVGLRKSLSETSADAEQKGVQGCFEGSKHLNILIEQSP